jgi:hypothetical protein
LSETIADALINPGLASIPPHTTLDLIGLDPQNKLLARNYWPPKTRILDSSQKVQRFRLEITVTDMRQDATGLRHCLNDQNARHNRIARKMPCKMWLVR